MSTDKATKTAYLWWNSDMGGVLQQEHTEEEFQSLFETKKEANEFIQEWIQEQLGPVQVGEYDFEGFKLLEAEVCVVSDANRAMFPELFEETATAQ